MKRSSWIIAAALASCTAVPVVAGIPLATATGAHCQVTLRGAAVRYTSLQAAVDAARPGAMLGVRGVCSGDTAIPAGDRLTIDGWRHATLAGGNSATAEGTVLRVAAGADVRLNSLVVTGGYDTSSGPNGGNGGGIDNAGTLTISGGSRVTGNTAETGGGIDNTGTLTITGGSAVNRNTGSFGGGIDNTGTLTITGWSQVDGNSGVEGTGIWNDAAGATAATTISNARIDGNDSSYGGGIINSGNGGIATVRLRNAQLLGNRALFGGGIWNDGLYGTATVTLVRSAVAGNAAATDGGGIYNTADNGTATIRLDRRTAVRRNSAGTAGGGIFTDTPATILNLTGSTAYSARGVNANTADLVFSGVPSSSPVNIDGN